MYFFLTSEHVSKWEGCRLHADHATLLWVSEFLFCFVRLQHLCLALADLKPSDGVGFAPLDINNPLDLTCERKKCAALEAVVGDRANCFCAFVSSTAKLHCAEPWTWPAHESEHVGQHGSKICQHPFDGLAPTQRGWGKGRSKRAGMRLTERWDAWIKKHQRSHAQMCVKLQRLLCTDWAPLFYIITNKRMWMQTHVLAEFHLMVSYSHSFVRTLFFIPVHVVNHTLKCSIEKCTDSILQQQ